MTNGGGASEKDRARRLTELLGFEVGPIISLFPRLLLLKRLLPPILCNHTPF